MTDLNHDQHPEGWSTGAEGYDVAFAPYTARYAQRALDLVGVGAGTRLLDVAAGSGAVSLQAAARGAEVTAIDFAPGMVDVLRRRLAAAGRDGARVEVMDGQALAFGADRFDAAVSMFGLMFFPDAEAGVAELRRVVKAGGKVAIGTWDLDGFRVTELVSRAIGDVLPSFAPVAAEPTWARLGRQAGLAELLSGQGLTEVTVHPVVEHWTFEEPEAFFRSMPTWAPPLQPLFDQLDEATLVAAGVAFARLVDARSDDQGVAVDALIAVGTT
jgi:ubiquinone/menaquinone biosynthesis C-methylase UbiE